ncbi:hypothetical protein KIW84_012999 [Lathyrus oleraceus]|uniref:Uncharacterized protein n=1 Tax=Pisum sativum TaxID=3888 RepID=A0A9D5BIZ5_PEA|nr:hypothetical protein KIW84_012999 [Pisum sativum]
MASPSKEFKRFTSEGHAQCYRAIFAHNIIEEKAWVLKHGELPEVTTVLKKHKLTHLNAQIQQVERDLMLEFYTNAYKAPDDEATGSTQLVSWVRGRIITGDTNEIPQSQKSLGHATVILLLCQKVGVEDLDGKQMLRSSCCLDPTWLKKKIVANTSEEWRSPQHPEASEAGNSEPPRQDISHGVPRVTLPVEGD